MAYLDHAATTPMLDGAIEAMTRQLREVGNPSSLHAAGRRARRAVEEAREAIAAALHARPADVVLTAGGTEADNLGIKGRFWAARAQDPRRTRILASAVEHHAVLDPVQWLADHEGAVVEWLPVDGDGVLILEALEQAIAHDPGSVALVTVMWANNEVGSLQPIEPVASVCHRHGIALHVDAVQAVAWRDIRFDLPGITSLAVSGHKVGGPMGSGALLLAPGVDPVPVLHGGGQERDVRSGTVDAASAVGLAAALTETVAQRESAASRVGQLRDALVRGVRELVPSAVVNGPDRERLPNIAHMSFPGCEGDALLMLLDAGGVQCSTGSACTAGVPQPSHVLLAMGVDPLIARSSLRFSLGRSSTRDDVDALLTALPAAHARALRAGLVGARA